MLVRAMTYRDGIVHDDIDGLVHVAGDSTDAREGIAALLDRRTPIFRGL